MDLLPKIELITTFLFADIQGDDGEQALDEIDKVLSGQEAYREIGGNVCALEISRNTTKVLDSLADDGIGNCCEIETDELKALIILWVKELRDFRMQHKYQNI